MQVLQVLQAKPGFFWTLLINSCMAYAVNLTNFMVTKYTSALTLQVGADPWLRVSGSAHFSSHYGMCWWRLFSFLGQQQAVGNSQYAVCCG
jgi:hypothetical protein